MIPCQLSGQPPPQVQWLLAADLFSAFNLDGGAGGASRAARTGWSSAGGSGGWAPPGDPLGVGDPATALRTPAIVQQRPLERLPQLRYTRADGALVFPPFSAAQYSAELHSTGYVCVGWNQHGALISRQVNVRAGKQVVSLARAPAV